MLQVNGDVVHWKYYTALVDRELKTIQRVCPKLTKDHVNLSSPMKMRVYLAVQVHPEKKYRIKAEYTRQDKGCVRTQLSKPRCQSLRLRD